MCKLVEHGNIDRKAIKRLALFSQSGLRWTLGDTPFLFPKDDLSKIPSVVDKILDQRPNNGLLLFGVL